MRYGERLWKDWYKWPTRIIVTVALTVILLPDLAVAQPSYEKLAKASEPYQKALMALSEVQEERDNIGRLGLAYSPGWRKKTLNLDATIQKLSKDLSKLKDNYLRESALWRKEMQPYAEIERSALEAIKVLRGIAPTTEINRKRALETFQKDVQKLYPESIRNLPKVIDEMSTLLRAGRPLKEIEAQVGEKFDDPGTKNLVEKLIAVTSDQISKAPQLSRVKAFNGVVSKIGNVLKIAKIINPDTSDPLETPQLNQLIDVVDVSKSGASGHPIGLALALQGPIILDIAKSTRKLRASVIKRNIAALTLNGQNRVDPYGDLWDGLTPTVLFGLPTPNPAIIPDKKEYFEGEPITGAWYGSISYDPSGWVGIVRADTSKSETLADLKDLDYIAMQGQDARGKFRFRSDIPAGNYHIRMYENDDGGELAASVRVAIKPAKSTQSNNSGKQQMEPDLSGKWNGWGGITLRKTGPKSYKETSV